MAAFGSGGARRWVERKPVDSRRIVSEYDVPRWQRALEAIAPWGCCAVAAATLILAGYAWATDLLVGHIR